MSLTSCYRYILELPTDTLNRMLRGALEEDEGAGVGLTAPWEGVVVGDFTATVSVRPTDLDTDPPTMSLLVPDLAVALTGLRLRVEVDVDEIPELDQIVYVIEFDLPGVLQKTADVPPRLEMRFPAVSEPSLNLVVTGGEVPLTAELVEPLVHDLYDATPALQHDQQNNVPWPVPGADDTTVQVTTDIYDDEPGSSGFRGAITVEVPDATHVVLRMPGHFRVRGISTTYINTDMIVDIKIAVEVDPAAGTVRARLDLVQAADVNVTFATSSPYDIAAKPILAGQIASQIRLLSIPPVEIPTAAEVRAAIMDRLLILAADLAVPIFTPRPPAAGDLDLTTFVATTVNQQVLALQLVPLADGTPCDTPDVFAGANGFSIAVAAVEVNPKLQVIADGAVGDYSDVAGSGYDVTLESLQLELSDPGAHGVADGHVWITGTAEVHVDCWPDPEIDFEGPVTLEPHEDPDGKLFLTAKAGNFSADDPCCGDIEPAQIASLIEGRESERLAMPKEFSGVGELDLTFTDVDVFAAGIVVNGSLDVVTTHALNAAGIRDAAYWWLLEHAGGG